MSLITLQKCYNQLHTILVFKAYQFKSCSRGCNMPWITSEEEGKDQGVMD